MLARARSLATEGKLSQAIAEATGIKPGRALYDEAKAAIAGWQGEIVAAERARQRALQRAATPTPTPETILEPTADPLTEDIGDLPIDPVPAAELAPSPVAPVPRVSRPRRSPLPERIETIPAEASSRPDGSAGSTPSPIPPEPLAPPPVLAPQPLPAPAPVPAAVSSPMPAPPVVPAPQPNEVAPQPIDSPQSSRPTLPAISARPQPEVPQHSLALRSIAHHSSPVASGVV
ncbi:MAG: hypothetical protein AAFW95_01630 [Cyanobacteria bacterium J06638_6]